jgi:hypothetical protein
LLILPVVIVVLAGLVAVFRRYEAPHPTVVPETDRQRSNRNGLAVVGVVLATVGILGFSMTGFTGITTFETETLVVMPVTPFLNLALLLAGWWIVQFAASPLRLLLALRVGKDAVLVAPHDRHGDVERDRVGVELAAVGTGKCGGPAAG